MREDDPRLGHDLRQARRHCVDVAHFIVDIVDLAFSGELPHNRFPYHFLVIFHDIGLDRNAAFRRIFENGHIPDPDKAHVKSPGDRRRRQGQNIHIFLHFFDLLFVGDAEALLFVHDKKPQVVELDVLGQQPVRPYNDIAEPLGELLDRLLLFRCGAESGEHSDRDGIPPHSLAEGVVVLLREDSGGHQNRDLFPFLYRFESCSDGDLCFAVSDVSADQAVHDAVALHVPFSIFNGSELVFRLLKGKHLLELLLPHRIRSEHMPLLLPPRRVQLYKVFRDLVDRALHLPLGARPLLGAKLVQLGLRSSCRSIFLEHRELCGKHIERSASAVLYFEIILRDAVDLDLLHAAVDPDAVVLVHHVIADLEL